MPLILAAWNHTTGAEKVIRLSEHIEWAFRHGSLELVAHFIRGLREDDWHHTDD